jgi:hypothetical protein
VDGTFGNELKACAWSVACRVVGGGWSGRWWVLGPGVP